MRTSLLCAVFALGCLVGDVVAREVDGRGEASEERSAAILGTLGALDGHVFGVTVGVGEAPMIGVEVFRFQLSDGQILDATTTDAAGFYTFTQVPVGEIGLFATTPGFDPQAAPVIVVTTEVAHVDFLLAPVDSCATCAFQDVTIAAGLGDYIAATGDGHGPGAVFADLNNDGYPDLYLMRAAGRDGLEPSANQLYVNAPGPGGSRQFVVAPAASGAGDEGNATGAIAGDYDNDGDLDLYVLNFDQPNALLQNQWALTGVLEFVDITSSTDPTPGVADDQFGVGSAFFEGIALDNSLTAAWADVDRDGDLDLYVGNHNGWFDNPIEGPFAVPGRRDVFYRNNGDGTFSDVTMQFAVPGYVTAGGGFQTPNQRFSSTNAVVFADFNNDRWPDLLVTNKIGGPEDRDMLYINAGAGAGGNWLGFDMVTYNLSPLFGHLSGAAMGVDVADADNDGDLDIYITDWSPPHNLHATGTNDLWLNQFADTGVLSFVHVDGLAARCSWGAVWQDFDNDGRMDLHVTTEGSFRDYLYRNLGSGIVAAGIDLGVAQVRSARGNPSADYDRDGWPDLFVTNLGASPVLYRNDFASFEPSSNHYLVVKLIGDPLLADPDAVGVAPFRSTRDAIGARVQVIADLNGDGQLTENETQLREVVSGHGNAASTSSLELEFGLGQAMTAELVVDWPSGRHSVRSVTANQFLVVREGASTAIPTASVWGLAVMVLLLSVMATAVFRRVPVG